MHTDRQTDRQRKGSREEREGGREGTHRSYSPIIVHVCVCVAQVGTVTAWMPSTALQSGVRARHASRGRGGGGYTCSQRVRTPVLRAKSRGSSLCMGLNEELWEAAECNQIDLVFTCGVYTCVQTFVLGWLRYAVCVACVQDSGLDQMCVGLF